MPRFACFLTCILAALGVLPVFGGHPQMPNPVHAADTPVYVGRFDQKRPTKRFGDLGEFAATLMRLRLAEEKSLKVIPPGEKPGCALRQHHLQQQVQGLPGEPSNKQGIPFYEIRGSVEVHPTPDEYNADIILDYELVRWDEHCQFTSLLHRSEAFAEKTALENLKVVADVLSSQLVKKMLSERPE